jgi:Ca2+-binding RTX toxin-like protein
VLYGGPGRDDMNDNDGGDDVLYGGDDSDFMLWGGVGEDVIYGGDGNDVIEAADDWQRDKLYCGEGKDHYTADTIDYVDSSCEEGELVDEEHKLVDTGGPSLILLAGPALLSTGLLLGRYVIRRAS